MRRTLTGVGGRALLSVPGVGRHLLAGTDKVLGTALPGELVLAFAHLEVFVGHLPLLHSSESKILPEQNVEPCVDGLNCFVSDEDNTIEAFEDHAYLSYVVPAIVAA